MTLFVTWRFIWKNPHTSQKERQFALRFTYRYAKNFALRNFSLNIWNWWRGGEIFILKKKHFALQLYLQKKITSTKCGTITNSHPVLLWIVYWCDKPNRSGTHINRVHLHVCMLTMKMQCLPILLEKYAIESKYNRK